MAHYKISVLEIGRDHKFPAGVAFDFWHMGDQFIYSPFSMTLIQGEGHNILFDCGFDLSRPEIRDRIAAEQDDNCHDPKEVLASVGLTPDDIDSVIISHCHWDHMSGLSYFPNSTIYIQRSEADNWLRAMNDETFPLTHKCVVDKGSLDTLFDLARAGKVIFLDGDYSELFPGISVKACSGHSFAQNVLLIDNDDGRYAIVGDVAMRPESFTGTDAFPCFLPNLKFSVGTIENIVGSYKDILGWVQGRVDRIVMSHDGTRHTLPSTTRSSLDLDVTVISE